MKSGIASLHQRKETDFNCGPYWLNIAPKDKGEVVPVLLFS